MTNINDKHIILPKWLDDLIFVQLSANYGKKNKDLVVLDWSKDDILCYLGTYFPRSFAESYCIFSKYFKSNPLRYEANKTISIFDFGCGTGGELIGFLVALSENLPDVKSVKIRALDGNAHALRILEKVLDKTSNELNIKVQNHLIPIIIDDFYDMRVVTDIITQKYDFIITFKAICEFVAGQQFEEKNPYKHIINTFLPKLSSRGVICVADITSFSNVSNDWLPKMLDKATTACGVEVIARNEGFNECYKVSHSKKSNDKSKIAWRIYKLQTVE